MATHDYTMYAQWACRLWGKILESLRSLMKAFSCTIDGADGSSPIFDFVRFEDRSVGMRSVASYDWVFAVWTTRRDPLVCTYLVVLMTSLSVDC